MEPKAIIVIVLCAVILGEMCIRDRKYPVVFEYAGQNVATVQLEVNDGEAIENTLKYGKVSGWKVDQDCLLYTSPSARSAAGTAPPPG